MRWLLLVTMLLAAGGCGRPRPTLAHGKPVLHWVQALREPDARARKRAADVLGNVGAVDPAVVPALAGAVRDRDPVVRRAAVLSLLKIGPAARDALPALLAARQDRDADVRACAVRAVEKLQADK